jgi:uncharacterized protein YdaU (DUF1376 family)
VTDIPAMMLWTDAYMADTSHLTTTEHGAYLLILMAMWRAGGNLPDDDVRLARTARLTLDKWRKIAPTIREFFTKDGDSVSQKRLMLELKIARSKNEKLAEAGRAGGRAKALKRHNTRSSDASQSPEASAERGSSNQNQNQSQIEERKNSVSLRSTELRDRANSLAREFDETFWPRYPHKVSKKDAAKAFAKARMAGDSLELIMAGLDRYIATKPLEYNWKDPCTFLNGEHFNDQPAPVSRGSPRPSTNGMSEVLDEIRRAKASEISSESTSWATPGKPANGHFAGDFFEPGREIGRLKTIDLEPELPHPR